MPLLDDELRGRLPPLFAQEADMDPTVYCRFHLPGTSQAWYVTEGMPDGQDFVFFGFVAGPNEFRQFRLSELERMRGLCGSQVERDPAFTEGRLTDVVPAPDE